MDIEASTKSEFYVDEFETDHKDNLESEITCNKSLLSGSCSAEQHILVLSDLCLAKHHVLKDIISIIEVDMMRSSPLGDSTSVTVDQKFLTNAVSWECRSI